MLPRVSVGTTQTLEFRQAIFPNGMGELVFFALLPWTGSKSTDLNIRRCQAENYYFPTSNTANLNVCMSGEPIKIGPCMSIRKQKE